MASSGCERRPSAMDARWTPLVQQNHGRFNVDKRSSPDFVKAGGHDGYFKCLKDIVLLQRARRAAAMLRTRPLAGAGNEREHEQEQERGISEIIGSLYVVRGLISFRAAATRASGKIQDVDSLCALLARLHADEGDRYLPALIFCTIFVGCR
jgi:hypothetical protein